MLISKYFSCLADMLTAVRCMLSKLVSPLWRAVEVNGEDTFSGASGKCNTPLKNELSLFDGVHFT